MTTYLAVISPRSRMTLVAAAEARITKTAATVDRPRASCRRGGLWHKISVCM